LKCEVDDIKTVSKKQMLIAGSCLKKEPLPFELSYAGFILRTNSELQIDNSFGDGGRIFFMSDTASFTIKSINVDDNGSIWATGNVTTPNKDKGQNAYVAKLDKNGKLDENFGNHKGIFILDNNEAYSTTVEDSVLQVDHSLVIVGWQIGTHQNTLPFIRKIYPEGALVPKFGNNLPLMEGKINRIYHLFHGHDLILTGEIHQDLLIVRSREDGQPVSDFGQHGLVRINIKGHDEGRAINMLPDGTILIGGEINKHVKNDKRYSEGVIVALDSKGNLHNHFAENGIRIIKDSQIQFSQVNNILISEDLSHLQLYTLGNETNQRGENLIAIRFFSPFGHVAKTMGTRGRLHISSAILGKNGTSIFDNKIFINGRYRNNELFLATLDLYNNKILKHPPLIPNKFSFNARIPESIMKIR
jgi:hypothetical protein